ncbi:hypothetical protein ACX80D_01905 [Arthrobacter sp. Sr24]
MKSSTAGLIGIFALALLVVAHYLGLAYTMGASMALAAIFGYGWPHYLGIPARKTLGTVIALTGVLAALTAGLAEGRDYLAWSAIYIAVGFGAIMVVQLIRGTGQKHRLESTLGAGAGVAVAGFACGWVASFRFLEEPGMTLIVAISAAAALLAGMLPWPDRVNAPLAIVLAVLAGTLAALLFSDLRIVPAGVLAAVVASVIAAFRRLRTLAAPLGVSATKTPAAEEPVAEVPVAQEPVVEETSPEKLSPKKLNTKKPTADGTTIVVTADAAGVFAADSVDVVTEDATELDAVPSPNNAPASAPANVAANTPVSTPRWPISRASASAAAALAPILSLGAMVYFLEKILLS